MKAAIKKLLCLLLALGLLLSAIPAKACLDGSDCWGTSNYHSGPCVFELRNVMQEPTCTEEGYGNSHCTLEECPESRFETLLPLGHDFVDLVCTRCGEHDCVYSPETGICTLCGDLCSHSFENGLCTICGFVPCAHVYEESVCTLCGEACHHSYGLGNVITEPTCSETGLSRYTCDFCGFVKDVSLPMMQHSFGQGVVVTAPTCFRPGNIHYTCVNCNYVKIDITPSAAHDYESSWAYPLVCGEQNRRTYTCKACAHSYSVSFMALPHFYQDNTCVNCGISNEELFSYAVLEAGTCKITGYSGSNRDVVIPERIDGYTVTTIGTHAFVWSDVTTITFPDTLKKIESAAFASSSLSNMYFTGDAPIIPNAAFFHLTLNALYPAGNETWTQDVMQDYGGSITWEAYCLEHSYQDGVCKYCGEAQPNKLLVNLKAPGVATVRLYVDGKEAPVYTATVADGAYRFDNLAAGAYTLRIECEGAVTREYPITVTNGENAQDAQICRAGDVNGDGEVNIGDVAQLYTHAKDGTQPEGYAAQCADLNGDETVNIGDVAKAYAATKN